MKPVIAIGAVLLLSACSGGSGGSGGVDLTPDSPSVSLNSSFGDAMQGVRLERDGGAEPLVYDQTVGTVAQEHANDNYVNDRSTDNGEVIDGIDVGSRLTDLGYDWEDIEVLRDSGDRSVEEQAEIFANDTSCDAFGGSYCVDQPEFEHFGVGRAGSGDDMRWVFIMTDPVD